MAAHVFVTHFPRHYQRLCREALDDEESKACQIWLDAFQLMTVLNSAIRAILATLGPDGVVAMSAGGVWVADLDNNRLCLLH